MEIVISLVALVVCIVVCLYLSQLIEKGKEIIEKGKEEIQFKLNNAEGFSASQEFIGAEAQVGIAIDESSKSICLVSRKENESDLDVQILRYKDILSCELFEDGQTITKTSRSSQLGGVLIGGLALGATGAIIGGLSGKTTSETGKIRCIDLRLIVNNTTKPCYDLHFIFLEAEKKSLVYDNAIQQARHWHGLLAVIIKIRSFRETD